MTKLTGTLLLAILVLAVNSASATGIGGEVGFARADGMNGGEIGIGYGYDVGPLKIAPIVGTFIYQEENERFRSETFSNGRTVCRDTATGQFADEELCNNVSFRAYGKIEGTMGIPAVGRVGGGYRISKSSTPYGTIIISAIPRVSIKGSVGEDYYSLGVTIGF